MQNKDQDVSVFLLDQVVNKNWNNVALNSGINTVCEFSNRNHRFISICSDLHNLVIEKLSNLCNLIILHKNFSTLLSRCNFNDSSNGQFPDGNILFLETFDDLLEETFDIQSCVGFATIVEVLINFNKYFCS